MTTDIRTALRQILNAHSSSAGSELRDDVLLDGAGLGLDSIAIAEVLLECEARFGMPAAPLLEGETITVGRLVEYFGATAAK